jgi:hypothetical protein
LLLDGADHAQPEGVDTLNEMLPFPESTVALGGLTVYEHEGEGSGLGSGVGAESGDCVTVTVSPAIPTDALLG